MGRTKTDNSFLSDKVAMRAAHLPPDPVRVLDCYAGRGTIWRCVAELTKRDIVTLPIDTRDLGFFHLPGDNTRYMETLDLSRSNVLDLDAYGVPYEQLRIAFSRGFQGYVFVTFIQSMYGGVNYGLLADLGFSGDMVKLCPTVFAKNGWAYFLEWLALNGVRRIWHRSHAGKHYLHFVTGEGPAPDALAALQSLPA